MSLKISEGTSLNKFTPPFPLPLTAIKYGPDSYLIPHYVEDPDKMRDNLLNTGGVWVNRSLDRANGNDNERLKMYLISNNDDRPTPQHVRYYYNNRWMWGSCKHHNYLHTIPSVHALTTKINTLFNLRNNHVICTKHFNDTDTYDHNVRKNDVRVRNPVALITLGGYRELEMTCEGNKIKIPLESGSLFVLGRQTNKLWTNRDTLISDNHLSIVFRANSVRVRRV